MPTILLSASIWNSRILFAFACLWSLLAGLGTLFEVATGDWRDGLGAAAFFGFGILMGWLSIRLVQVRLVNRTIEIRSLFSVLSLGIQDFLNIEVVSGLGHMRMDFKQSNSVYFLPNYLISYPLIDSFEAWSRQVQLSRGEQADFFCERVYQLMR